MNMSTFLDLSILDYCKRLIDGGMYEVIRKKKSLLFKDWRIDKYGNRSHRITIGFPGETGQLEMDTVMTYYNNKDAKSSDNQ